MSFRERTSREQNYLCRKLKDEFGDDGRSEKTVRRETAVVRPGRGRGGGVERGTGREGSFCQCLSVIAPFERIINCDVRVYRSNKTVNARRRR